MQGRSRKEKEMSFAEGEENTAEKAFDLAAQHCRKQLFTEEKETYSR